MKRFFVAVLAVCCLFAGCKPKVESNVIYTTIAPVNDFARKIIGDKYEVKLLVKGDIHGFEPSAAEMAELESSKMIIFNGYEIDSFVHNLSENMDVVYVESSMGVEAIDAKGTGHVHEDGTVHYEGDGHDHGNETTATTEDNPIVMNSQGYHVHKDGTIHYGTHGEDTTEATAADQSTTVTKDPHVWMYPLNAKLQMLNICEAMVEIDPANESYYRSNYDTYAKKCDELDAKFQNLKGKTIVTTHGAYGYWAEKYGINVVAMDTSGEEVSPAKMKEIVQFCKDNNISVIYYEETGTDDTAQAVAREIGGTVKPLNSYEAVIDGKDDYFTLMEQNYESLSQN